MTITDINQEVLELIEVAVILGFSMATILHLITFGILKAFRLLKL